MTNATETLRRMLDERGVEWSAPSGVAERFADSMTFIGDRAVVSEIEGGGLLRISFDGTPEQAIAATLGGGKLESSKERLQKMLDEMKKLARDGQREWCGRSHGEFAIFVALEDFAETTERQIDRPWMWR